jgi:hypothetical protein
MTFQSEPVSGSKRKMIFQSESVTGSKRKVIFQSEPVINAYYPLSGQVQSYYKNINYNFIINKLN